MAGRSVLSASYTRDDETGADRFAVSVMRSGAPPLRNQRFARLTAGGRWIRTIVPATEKLPLGAPCGFRARVDQLGAALIPRGTKLESAWTPANCPPALRRIRKSNMCESRSHLAGVSLTSREAIYQACPKRFRPIIMSTMAAMFRAVPLACGAPCPCRRSATLRGTMAVSFSDLQLAFEFVSSGGRGENE